MTKLLVCLTLALLLASTCLLIGVPPRPSWVSEKAVFAGAILGLLAPLIWLAIPKPTIPLQQFRDTIAYLTGFGISTFGWKKLMHLQFRTPLSFADLPASQLNGETLTWFYFGHSFTFACIVGILQITGGALLLFRRTRLAGAIIVFPVMLNILLINIFYQMNAGALLQSITLTIGVTYIIGLHTRELLQTLFASKTAHMGWIGPAIVIILPFLFVRGLRTPPASPMYGRYTIEKQWINGEQIRTTGRDSVLTKIYFDLDNVCVLEYNDQHRRRMAPYTFTERPAITIDSKQLAFSATIDKKDDSHWSLHGNLAKDSIAMILRKED